MEALESFLKFISSYPAWAKIGMIGGLLFSASILIFASRLTSAESNAENGDYKRVFLRIEEIKLFPNNDNTEIQLFAMVNGNRYRHPNVAGVEWMKVGPNMSHKIIELPNADRYEIRFEINYRDGQEIGGSTTVLGKDNEERAMVSQMITPVSNIPFDEEYKLYPVKNMTRSASVGASVQYSVYGTN